MIKKEETAQIIYEGDNRLMYWDKFLGYDSNITYCFYDNKLNNGYISIESAGNKNKIYSEVATELEKVYGEPYSKTEYTMKFKLENNSIIYLSNDGDNVAVLFAQK